ncbi:hypothetical protein M758_3G060600, partial [Ceratodon purpureus]
CRNPNGKSQLTCPVLEFFVFGFVFWVLVFPGMFSDKFPRPLFPGGYDICLLIAAGLDASGPEMRQSPGGLWSEVMEV